MRHGRGAVHASIDVPRGGHGGFEDVEHLLRLREEQRAMALFLPQPQHAIVTSCFPLRSDSP